jgi:hypothetical protein
MLTGVSVERSGEQASMFFFEKKNQKTFDLWKPALQRFPQN